eukprot:TRINITY_DN771_c5_g1_i1.p1 TRINITY_DN771_c5_g1~~TRINITY_DN771_c5_g1_i1.p1  ORF type:complete len:1316 (-),score=198.99 TRINITY_DN771_c5_g1_i1:331-4227(-)
MASLQVPQEHYISTSCRIVCSYLKLGDSFKVVDTNNGNTFLGTPVLTLAEGLVVSGDLAIVRYICSLDNPGSENLLPQLDLQKLSKVDQWLESARQLYLASLEWLTQSPQSSEASREISKNYLQKVLGVLNKHFKKSTFLVDQSMSIADIVYYSILEPLFQNVLGREFQSNNSNILRWAQTISSQSAVKEVLGDLKLCAQREEFNLSSKRRRMDSGSQLKDNGIQDASSAMSTSTSQTSISVDNGGLEKDPEKEAKKKAKALEKEKKKQKAKEKAEKAKQQSNGGVNEKKKKAKEEAEEKKKKEAEEIQAEIEAAKAAAGNGQKKDLSRPMFKGYLPAAVETGWYEWWEKCGYFQPDLNSDKKPFVMVIPPPNVTGALHIGHALTNAVEDTITRWRRMMGYNTIWVPGTDHAGIATQTVVEKKLARERKITRHDIGREVFLEEVHAWVKEYGGKIHNQLRRMGSSVDWSRLRFTMDDDLCKAVKEAFLQMHKKGLIYRDNRLVNWCCTLKTAVSDIEVDYIDITGRQKINVPGYDKQVEFGVLTEFAYPLEDGSGEIVVATTRPETMLGDTAVAVHPEDSRYKHLHGKFVVHPENGRKLPIVCDAELVDMEFGTGAVKITPAHDPNDFLTGKRHKLDFINILDDDGNINANGGQFESQPRFVARETVVKFLEEKGLLRGTQDNPMRLGLCSRSKDVIEPVLKPQWWVSCGGMAADACEAVRDGRLKIIPKDFEAVWFRWLENIRDWCISRQLWWGHRIPAYYITFEEEIGKHAAGAPSEIMDRWVVAGSLEEAQKLAEEKFPDKRIHLSQDEDVLDTWFSSGLFPFSVFKWPEHNIELEKFYPGSLLETGHDILFFWVARMVMMGMTLMGDVPFKEVFLHAMVRDAHGRKMSKSLGNVIDPIHVIEGISLEGLHVGLENSNLDPKEIAKAKEGQKKDFPEGIEECGTDALRFALVAYTSQARDINLDIKRVVGYSHWCNKLWNAIRFAILNLGENFQPSPAMEMDVTILPFSCQWILSCLTRTAGNVMQYMYDYNFSAATQALFSFWLYDLCDYFIELMKPVMQTRDEGDEIKQQTRQTLWVCLDHGLRLLHPFMPFLTEELWQRLPRSVDQARIPSIMISEYPKQVDKWLNPQIEESMNYLKVIIGRCRQLKNDYGMVNKDRPDLYVVCTNQDKRDMISSCSAEITTMTLTGKINVNENSDEIPKGCGVAVVDDACTLYLMLKGILDPVKELEKLAKRLENSQKQMDQLQKRMAEGGYQEKTPEELKMADTEKLQKIATEIGTIEEVMVSMRQMLDT